MLYSSISWSIIILKKIDISPAKLLVGVEKRKKLRADKTPPTPFLKKGLLRMLTQCSAQTIIYPHHHITSWYKTPPRH